MIVWKLIFDVLSHHESRIQEKRKRSLLTNVLVGVYLSAGMREKIQARCASDEKMFPLAEEIVHIAKLLLWKKRFFWEKSRFEKSAWSRLNEWMSHFSERTEFRCWKFHLSWTKIYFRPLKYQHSKKIFDEKQDVKWVSVRIVVVQFRSHNDQTTVFICSLFSSDQTKRWCKVIRFIWLSGESHI